MILDLKSQQIEVNYNGKQYMLKEASVLDIQEFLKANKDSDHGIGASIELLARCGLPREVSETLTSNNLAMVIKAIMKDEKKS